jgi:uncharacterized protein
VSINDIVAANLQIPLNKVSATVKLLQEANTIPFIARYRKEVTGNLDEEQIRAIFEEHNRLENLEDRRQTILQSIKDQGKLTNALKQEILSANQLTILEDLYLPYRPKRRTKASVAKENGLEPLADLIIMQLITQESLGSIASQYFNQVICTKDQALAGARDIVAEKMSENASVRQAVREYGLRFGKLKSERIESADDERKLYELYYHFDLNVKQVKPHQVLAINRGERDNILRVSVIIDDNFVKKAISAYFEPNNKSIFYESLLLAAEDCAKRLLLPAIERDIRRTLTEIAEEHAINVFANNLKALLSQPPLSGQVVLAIDPGFRTGSKVVVVDPTGMVLEYTTIYPHPPQNQIVEAIKTLDLLIKKHSVTLVVIGNGTASRETEAFIAEITKNDNDLHYLITSEAGASVYSASKIARKEFPNLDVSIRGAVSIARRVQDPLAELVKIDPKSIGVGLYQHDVNQTKLNQALGNVVESIVNSVGVDINTASPALLSYVSGIGGSLAEKIISYREKNGPFTSREQIKKVPGFGPKTYEQSAGFLRISNAENFLDSTGIHPERYNEALDLINLIQFQENPNSIQRQETVEKFVGSQDKKRLAKSLGIGLLTLEDILNELSKPGRDPREDLPKPILRKDILSFDDLSPGTKLKGTIRNVVDFGVFVDIGLKTDGLLHRSKYPVQFVPRVGDIIDVVVLTIDHDRNRIALDVQERAA